MDGLGGNGPLGTYMSKGLLTAPRGSETPKLKAGAAFVVVSNLFVVSFQGFFLYLFLLLCLFVVILCLPDVLLINPPTRNLNSHFRLVRASGPWAP